MESVALPTNDKKVVEKAENGWVCPEFKVSGAFSSHMVLQREKPVKIWGFSTSYGKKVFCEFSNREKEGIVGDDGKWVITLPPMPYNRDGQTMRIYDEDGHEVIFEDILIGDVWLIGGQSNAELTLAPCMSITPSVEFYEEEKIRLFTQTQAYVYNNQKFCDYPQPDIINPEWCWKTPTKEACYSHSAISFYFAREVSRLSDVPQGMIMMAAGGACVRELWPEHIAHSEGYHYGANVRESGYYNALIHPFIGLSFKAMIFFQGESEGGSRELAEKYTYELALLVADERRSFGFEFPFYNVQISSYREEGGMHFPYLHMIRMKQFEAQYVIPNSTLSVSMDLESPEDYPDWAHSPRKLEVAERLSKLALAKEYGIGRESEVSSPMPTQVYYDEDSKQIVIDFKDVSAGLTSLGHTPVDSIGMEVCGFSVGDIDNMVDAKATIGGRSSVIVEVPEGVNPTHVNYAYYLRITEENATLRGGNNLPCPAFSLKI